jgi:hypothetical protein
MNPQRGDEMPANARDEHIARIRELVNDLVRVAIAHTDSLGPIEGARLATTAMGTAFVVVLLRELRAVAAGRPIALSPRELAGFARRAPFESCAIYALAAEVE